MKESTLLTLIRNTLGRLPNVRLWRNNVGMLKDERGQFVRYGLCSGSADLIGFTSITITPEMVGRRVAVLTCIETKAGRGKATAEQENFINVIHAAGGFAGLAYSVEQAEAICTQIQNLVTPLYPETPTSPQPEPQTKPPKP